MATAAWGTELAEYTRDGDDERVRAVFTVSDLTGNPTGRAIAAASAGQIPRYDSPHPTRPDLRARRFRTASVQNQPNTFSVEVTWLNPDAAAGEGDADALGSTTVSVATEVISEVTTRDIRGRELTTFYTRFLIGTSRRQNINQTHRVTVERPTFGLKITRVEGKLAFRNAALFSGQVNRKSWQGFPAKHWIMSVSSEQIDEDRHRVTYSAVYNKKSWRSTLISTLNGVIPEPVPTLGNGLIVRDVYEDIDFNKLRLPRYL